MSDDLVIPADIVPEREKRPKGKRPGERMLVPDPASVDKPLTSALRALVERKPELLDMLVLALFEKAIAGNTRAAELLFNRLDGKLSEDNTAQLPNISVVLQKVEARGRMAPDAPREIEVSANGKALED